MRHGRQPLALLLCAFTSFGCKSQTGFTSAPAPAKGPAPLQEVAPQAVAPQPAPFPGVEQPNAAPKTVAPHATNGSYSALCALCVDLLNKHASANGNAVDASRIMLEHNSDGSCLVEAPNLSSADGADGTVGSCDCNCRDFPVANGVNQSSALAGAQPY